MATFKFKTNVQNKKIEMITFSLNCMSSFDNKSNKPNQTLRLGTWYNSDLCT